jgi:hypothetical protein
MDQRRVPCVLLEHRVNQDRLTTLLTAQQIGVCGRDLIEELTEDHLMGLRVTPVSNPAQSSSERRTATSSAQ